MFFNDLFQRRLASLLRPWLRQEPDLELKLGFLRSHGIAKNLSFDPSVLNQLLDESTPFSFKDVRIEQLSLRVSYWSVPTFAIEVHGVHVTLSVGDEDRGLRPRRKPTDTSLEDMKKVLAQIDPEGSALHDMMERISDIGPSISRTTSLLNVILNRCRLQIHDINLQVLFPILNNSFACLWEIKEVIAESRYIERGCFLRGIITSLFFPLKESTLSLDVRGLEIGLKNEDRISYVLPSLDLFTSIKLKDLQLIDFNISIPELRFLFSPVDLHIILAAFDRLSSNKSKCVRSGRQLWKIASSRISSLISTPKLSLYKLVDDVGLWLRYVHAYENLLLLVGYPADNIIKRSVVMMSLDNIFSRSLKSQWNLISEFEKKLPAEAIAQAWRITRYRVALDVQQAKGCSNESLVNSHFQKILPGLALIWNIICSILNAIIHSLFLQKFLADQQKMGRFGVVSEDSCLQCRFSLSMGKFSIMVFPTNVFRPPVGGNLVSDVGISYSELLSFCLSTDAFFLTHTKNICEQCYFFTCGHLKIMSSSVVEDGSYNKKSYLKESLNKKVDDAKTILWSEPAQMFCPADTRTGSTNDTEGISVPFLEKLLGEMCLNWKKSCTKFESSRIQYMENPWILCEIKIFLTDQGLKNLNSGFWKCSLIVGKLNFVMDFLSLLSIALLLRQTQHAIYWANSSRRTKVFSPTLTTFEDSPVINSNGQCKSYTTGTEVTIFRMLPVKHIQIGVFIAGPCIQISTRKEWFHGGNADLNHIVAPDDFHLVFDVHNIEFAVWPSLKSDFGSSGCSGMDDAGSDCLSSMDPQIIEIPKSDNEIYSCHGRVSLYMYLKVNGLNAYFDDSAENQQNQIIVLSPTTIRVSSLREDLYSFSTAVIAFSAALQGMATGLTFLLYMDELFVLVKVMVGIFSAVSCAFTSFDSFGVNFQEFTRQEMVCADSEREGTLVMMAKGTSLICMSTLFAINGTFEFKSIDMILHDSRKSNDMETFTIPVDVGSSKNLAMCSMPEYGIWVSVQRMFLSFSVEREKVEAFSDFSGIRSVIFRNQSETGKSSDQFEIKSLLQHSLNCLCEMSLSRCTFTWLGYLRNSVPSGSENNADEGSTSRGNCSKTMEDSPSEIATERSRVQSLNFFQKLSSSPNIIALASSHKLIVKIVVSEICIVRCSLKNTLVEGQNSNNLESSLIVGGEFQTISCQIQGGTIFLEMSALAMFVQCCASFSHCIRNLLHVLLTSEKHIIAETVEDVVILDGRPSQELQNTFPQVKWFQLELFTIDLSQFSLILVATDESGLLRELLFEADVHLNLDLANMNRKFSFGLSRLSILSQILYNTAEQRTSETQSPHFSSVISSDLSPHSVHEDPTVEFQHTDGIHPVLDYASCSSPPVSLEESFGDNSIPRFLQFSCKNYILKQLGAFISVEIPVSGDEISSLRLNHDWVGSGSITGFDVTISLPEIQMLLSTIESLSGVFSKETSGNVEQENWPNNQESDRSLEERVPDGAIVAIQDVHQHMYMTVEGVDNKYSLVGAIHYSLVGERALFRVKYHTQRRWGSSVLLFSLISLHAKSDLGEPLRLNYRRGSDFVDISSTNDSGWALWRTLSSKPESYEGDIELESYNLVAKNTFYLVNKKNDRAVAFVDGVPEFVSKPGNLFKWKVFCDLPPACDAVLLDSSSVKESTISLQHNSHVNKERGKFPFIVITIEKVTLTIVHELSDTMEKFPLLQGSISADEFIVQILFAKARIMSTLKIMLTYFDARHNIWRELVHPVEVIVFYRSKFQVQDSETLVHGVPVHFYARIKELGISITELSLDILLFVIGKLNLAGPYAIRSSMILANCCKVENHSGLNLLCQFYDNQEATIARKQSSTIILRHLTLVNQPPEVYSVSIKLAWQGAALTSPIHLSMLDAGALAWRTRILSLKDSKTYPGPFVVVDISRDTEDGLSIVVSPLLRIHNETEFSMELRFQRPQQEEAESASAVLKTGDTIDDSTAAFDAMNFSGGLKKALMSLSVGNFLFSFRPEIKDDLRNFKKSLSVEWSEDLKGGKAVRLSGLFDKLSYKVRKVLSAEPVRCSFSTAHCSLKSQDEHVADVHFLIQTIGRDIPVVQPQNYGYAPGNRNSPVALQEQKEIFLLPTVRVFNLLQSEIHVLLTDTDPCAAVSSDYTGNQATIPCGSTVDLYVNPATIYFIVTLTEYNSSSKPVNSGDWVKKLQKQKNDLQQLDIDLEFGGGKYFASLRLFCGNRGILEVAIFTSYTLKNDTDFSLFCFAPNQKPLSRDDAEKLSFRIPPEVGSFLPPKSTRSWFMKYNKVHLKLLEEKASEVLLDLDSLSGLTEIGLEVEERSGFKRIAKLGLSLGPIMSKVNVPSHIISIVPRYVVFNESEEVVIVRQCYLEDGVEGMVSINGKQKIALELRSVTSMKREVSVFENLLRKHRNSHDDSLVFIQFRPNEAGLDWSGPVCIASLGRFFLKFRRSLDFTAQQSNQVIACGNILPEFAALDVVEEGSTLGLHFHRPPNISLPYRIENCLHETFITYYQKGSLEPEILGCGSSVSYVWDDLTLPHRLVVQINDVHLLREINLDKLRTWKPFYRVGQHRGLGFLIPLDKKTGDLKRTNFGESNSIEMVHVGYEVYADGPTRVLRICEFSGSHKGDTVLNSSGKLQLRISYFAIHLLQHAKQEIGANEPSVYTPIIVTRLENINLDSMFTDMHNYNQISVQSLSVDEKWEGAPFAAMLRRHRSDYGETNDNILHVVLVLLASSSNVKQVKYSSVVLQPLDLNLDEETLMKIVPFWRTSLSDSSTQSQQYYFDHFEIHPIKIIASFLPGDSYSSYSSTQETLRSLLHSVIKIPAIKNMTVELNGVLVTHALITIRELFLKCAQHYSWYAMRAIYIAKGSPLLPPAFASIFDDLASSSLDVFFDPSRALLKLPGLTIGTFKLISKCINGKGISGTKRYFGDLGKTVKTAGSNILFAAVTEISDSVLKGAEKSGFNGMVSGFHQGILKLAMEPSLLGTAFMEGGPDRKIKLDQSPGVDELYIEGYLQAMLDTIYKQEYLRVRVIDNQVFLKNLPPNSSLIDEIMDRVKDFLVSKALLKGDSSTASRSLRHIRGESEWKLGPTVLTLCEHLFVSFVIRALRKQAGNAISKVKLSKKLEGDDEKAVVPASKQKVRLVWKWGIGMFVLSGIVAYIDGRLCRYIPNPLARRIVSGFLLSFLDKNDNE